MRWQSFGTATAAGLVVIASLAGANLADAKAKVKHKPAHKPTAVASMTVHGPSMLVLKRRDGVAGGQINVTEARATSADDSVHFSYSYHNTAYRFPASVSVTIVGTDNMPIGQTTIDVPNYCMLTVESEPPVVIKVSRPIGQIVGYSLVQTSTGAIGSACHVGAEH